MASQRLDRLWHNARLATMSVGQPGLGRVERGAIGCRDGRIAYIGPEAGAAGLAAAERIDCGGRLITPGLIDCHTHLVYGGSRANEFEQRLAGATYEEIARAGGGIASVAARRRSTSSSCATGSKLSPGTRKRRRRACPSISCKRPLPSTKRRTSASPLEG